MALLSRSQFTPPDTTQLDTEDDSFECIQTPADCRRFADVTQLDRRVVTCVDVSGGVNWLITLTHLQPCFLAPDLFTVWTDVSQLVMSH